MLALAVLLSLGAAYALGGRLGRMGEASLCGPLLPLAAWLLQGAGQALARCFSWDVLAPWVILASYGLIFCFVILNRQKKKTALFFGAGSLVNFFVIVCNGFRMPVGQQAAALLSWEGAAALEAGEIPMYALSGAHTRFAFLGDVICLPLLGAASLGDLLLGLGVFFLVMALMRPSRPASWKGFWEKG